MMQFGLKVVAVMGGKTIEGGACFEDCNAVTVQGHNHLYDTPMAAQIPTEQSLNDER